MFSRLNHKSRQRAVCGVDLGGAVDAISADVIFGLTNSDYKPVYLY